MKIFAKLFVLVAAAALVSACAQPARTTALVTTVTDTTLLAEGNPLAASVEVGSVTGGDSSNPEWIWIVTNESFETALNQSLAVTAMLAPQGGPYSVNTKLIRLDAPFAGASMTVITTAQYSVKNNADDVVFDEVIETTHRTEFSEAFLGVKRGRLAVEGSVKKNITRFIELLIEQSEADPEKFS